MNTTKDGTEVKAGQVWRDLDKRMRGRLLRVWNVAGGFAYVRSYNPRGNDFGRCSRISVSRMHRHATGFELVEEAESAIGPLTVENRLVSLISQNP